MTPKRLFELLKKSAQGWSDDKATTMAAALSYYTMFSVAPLLLIAVGVAGLVFGEEAARGAIHGQISGLVGTAGAKVIESMMASAAKPSTGILATVIGGVALLFGASGVFVQLQDSLNIIWKVKPDKSSGIMSFLKHRFLSLTLVLAIGFILLVSLAVSAGVSAVGTYLGSFMPGSEALWHFLEIGLSFAIITVLFAMIYKFLPDADVRWSDTWLGAAVTSFLFAIGKFGIGLYLGKSSVASSFGAAGSVAIVLVWVYYAAQILFFGAEFTHAWAEHHALQPKAGKARQGPGFFARMFRKKAGPKKDEPRGEEPPPPPSQWLPH